VNSPALKNKTQKELHAEALANFEKEMTKHKDYFRNYGVYALIYTDSDLADPDKFFDEIKRYLVPTRMAPFIAWLEILERRTHSEELLKQECLKFLEGLTDDLLPAEFRYQRIVSRLTTKQ
jgi:hypothetical protein